MPEQFITRDFTPAKRNSSIAECISPNIEVHRPEFYGDACKFDRAA